MNEKKLSANSTHGKIAALLFAVAVMWIAVRGFQWWQASGQEPQAYLVLGGSAVREVFATTLIRAHPDRIVLISGGSPDPCLWLMLKKNGVSMDKVWTEHCSKTTFDNFVYSLPLLERMRVRKVALVTDHPQVDRAMPIANIVFASHGMAVQFENVPQLLQDNKPPYEIAGLTIMALGWAVLSQVWQPICPEFIHLPDVDMKDWYRKGFSCEQQSGVDGYRPPLE